MLFLVAYRMRNNLPAEDADGHKAIFRAESDLLRVHRLPTALFRRVYISYT